MCSCPLARWQPGLQPSPVYWKAPLPLLTSRKRSNLPPGQGWRGVAHSSLYQVASGLPFSQSPLSAEGEFLQTLRKLLPPASASRMENGGRLANQAFLASASHREGGTEPGEGTGESQSTSPTGPWVPLPSRNPLNRQSDSPLCDQTPQTGHCGLGGLMTLGSGLAPCRPALRCWRDTRASSGRTFSCIQAVSLKLALGWAGLGWVGCGRKSVPSFQALPVWAGEDKPSSVSRKA